MWQCHSSTRTVRFIYIIALFMFKMHDLYSDPLYQYMFPCRHIYIYIYKICSAPWTEFCRFSELSSCACDMRVLKPTPTFSGNAVHERNRWCGNGAYIPAAVCKLLSISSISCSRKEESGPGDALISKGVERTFSAIFAFIPASTSGSSRLRLWLVCCWSDVIRMLLGLLVDLQPTQRNVCVCRGGEDTAVKISNNASTYQLHSICETDTDTNK